MGMCPWQARRGQSPFTQDPDEPFWSPQSLNLILHGGTHVSRVLDPTVLFFSSFGHSSVSFTVSFNKLSSVSFSASCAVLSRFSHV